ncbi:hypothetical protein P7L78_22035 [Tistrella bauzanensis]|uniref:hypothetical protein n=1 Tax=Tistrella TaxID=171436 RepID=UPI0031F62686
MGEANMIERIEAMRAAAVTTDDPALARRRVRWRQMMMAAGVPTLPIQRLTVGGDLDHVVRACEMWDAAAHEAPPPPPETPEQARRRRRSEARRERGKRGRPRQVSDPAATPETLAKLRPDAVLLAVEQGLLTSDLAQAAMQIADAVDLVAGAQGYRCNAGLGNAGGGAPLQGAKASALDIIHTAWVRETAAQGVRRDPVLAMVRGGARMDMMSGDDAGDVIRACQIWVAMDGATRDVRWRVMSIDKYREV